MKAIIVLLKLFVSYMSIYLSGRDIGMAEHLLDRTYIGVVLDEMGRKRVTKSVR